MLTRSVVWKGFIGVACLLFSIGANAQNVGEITGKIVDSQTGEPIPYASVVLPKDAEEAKEKGRAPQSFLTATTDTMGDFILTKVPLGTHDLYLQFIGYSADTIRNVQVSEEKLTVNLGSLKLVSSDQLLDGVEVTGTAQTSTAKLDRRSYQADDFETTKGGTAVDVLSKLPQVTVSPDGEVAVRGTTDFMVYLNGKPTQMEPSMFLAQIPSDNIERIEVISVPSARYDAQGKGGIINIVLKKSSADGLSLSANGVWGGAPWANKRDKYSGYVNNDRRNVIGANFSYKKDKLTVRGGGNYNIRNVNGRRTGDARIWDDSTGSYKHMVASGERPEWYEFYTLNAGLDWELSDKSELSASYLHSNRREGRSAYYIYNQFFADQNKIPIPGVPTRQEHIYNPNTDNRYGKFHTASLDYHLKGENKNDLKASFLYEHANLSRNLDNANYGFDPVNDQVQEIQAFYNQSDETPLDGFRLIIDYEKEFDNGGKLGAGIQPQYLSIAGNFNYDTLDIPTNTMRNYASLSNGINQQRGIYAGYMDYSHSLGKLTYLVGLRLEYTDQTMDIRNPNYFSIFERPTQGTYTLNRLDWFPTLHAEYPINDESKLIFAASRRISRPPVKNMAPFLYRRHLEVYVVGDPALKPEYVNNVELGLDKSMGEHDINITAFYRGVDNAIFRVNTVYQEELVLIRSYTNSGNSQSLGAELNANLVAGKLLKLYLGGSLYQYRIQGEVFGYNENNSSTNWTFKANANINLTKQLKWTVDSNVRSATVTAQGANDLFYIANTALTYSMKKAEGLKFALRVFDILSSNITGLDTRAFNSAGQQIFYQETEYTRNGPVVELGITYVINTKGKLKKPESSFGKDEF